MIFGNDKLSGEIHPLSGITHKVKSGLMKITATKAVTKVGWDFFAWLW
jgi:hypothetical protein